jgi:hypothetical protein
VWADEWNERKKVGQEAKHNALCGF